MSWVAGLPYRVRRSPRLLAVRLLTDASPWLAAALAAWTVLSAVAPVLLLAASGRLVGAVPATLRDGATAAEERRLGAAVVACGVLYVMNVALGPVLDGLRMATRARLTFALQTRLIAAVGRPVGIDHLEDETTLNRVAGAQGSLTNYFPADAPVSLAAVLAHRLSGAIACVLVATHWWWLGVLLAVLWLVIRKPLQSILLGYIAAFGGEASVMRRADYLLQVTTGAPAAKEIRVWGLAGWLVERFRTHWFEGMQASWRTLSKYRRTVAALAIAVVPLYAFATWVIADAARSGELGVADVALLLPAIVLAANVGAMTLDDVQLQWMLAALPNLRALEGDLAQREATFTGAGAPPGRPIEDVTFDRVGFAYKGSDRVVFRELDLRLVAGQSAAIVGANGAGKTTLVKLLCRLHDPTSGRILVDGVPLTDIEPVSWRRATSVVFQDFNRYPLSLADNVTLGAVDHADDVASLRTVAGRVGLDEVVASLPDGWDTVLSSRYPGGVDLSGGQWQRVALARGLFAVEHGARVLVLDEPTASLDVRAEAEFYDRFLELTAGVTSVIISHRFATVRRATTIYVIDEGMVIEQGSHDELVALGGMYAEMFAIQAARFADAGGAR